MRRADRLMELIKLMRRGRLMRAEDLAARLGVSARTVYRDMDTLVASGIPVEGNRGRGYRMTAPITLPPLNMTMAELEALHLGLAVVAEAGDEELQGAAKGLAARIDAALPEDRAANASGWGFAIYPFADAAQGFVHMPVLRAAIRTGQKLRVLYAELDKRETVRVLRPLELDYWGRVWSLTAWCETSGDFVELRVDRIRGIEPLPEGFSEEDGKNLADYRARFQARV